MLTMQRCIIPCLIFGAVLAERGVDLSNSTDIDAYWHDFEYGLPSQVCFSRPEYQPSRQLKLPARLMKPTSLFGHVLDEGNVHDMPLHNQSAPVIVRSRICKGWTL